MCTILLIRIVNVLSRHCIDIRTNPVEPIEESRIFAPHTNIPANLANYVILLYCTNMISTMGTITSLWITIVLF